MAFPYQWQRVCPLTIDYTLVSADSLTYFPLLLTAASLPDEMLTTGDPNAAQSDGGDICFSTDPSGLDRLSCEIVKWTQNANPASAVAEIWVSVPAISGTTETTIYVWYSKQGFGASQPAANATYGSQAVWSAANVLGCWHLGDGSSLTLTDSTASALTGTNHGATAATGKIGGGASFAAGSSQYISMGTASALALTTTCCAQAWIKASVVQPDAFPQIFSRTDAAGVTGWNLYLTGGGVYGAGWILKETGYAWGNAFAEGTTGLNDNAWHFVFGVYLGSRVDVYVDGVRVGTDASNGAAIEYPASPVVEIGAKGHAATTFFDGTVDEVRFTSGVRSAGWIATEYNNQSDPGSFTTAGDPYSPGQYADTTGYYGRQTR